MSFDDIHFPTVNAPFPNFIPSELVSCDRPIPKAVARKYGELVYSHKETRYGYSPFLKTYRKDNIEITWESLVERYAERHIKRNSTAKLMEILFDNTQSYKINLG